MKEIPDRPSLALFWSTGKDSAMALHILKKQNQFRVSMLVLTLQEETRRVSMHGIPEKLALQQAGATCIPVHAVYVRNASDNTEYEKSMEELRDFLLHEKITHVAFGDIFLEDLKEYRKQLFEPYGFQTVFPLWKKNTHDLLQFFFKEGFGALIICSDHERLGREYCGRWLHPEVVKSFPPDVDPCGENGEFHTFCCEGPVFRKKIYFRKGSVIARTYRLDENREKVFYFLEMEEGKD